MRLVVLTNPGVLELNYVWLPTWLGLNLALKVELESLLSQEVVGKEVTEELLDHMHNKIVDHLTTRFSFIVGLKEHLNDLHRVSYVVKASEGQPRLPTH